MIEEKFNTIKYIIRPNSIFGQLMSIITTCVFKLQKREQLSAQFPAKEFCITYIYQHYPACVCVRACASSSMNMYELDESEKHFGAQRNEDGLKHGGTKRPHTQLLKQP